MPGLSLREAAREAGVSKSTILRAIQRGRLSAARTDDGGYDIQPAELFRIYEPRTSADRTGNDAVGQDAPASVQEATAVLQAENEGLRNQITTLRELADEMKAQRDSWQRQTEAAQLQATTAQQLLADLRPAAKKRWFGLFKAAG